MTHDRLHLRETSHIKSKITLNKQLKTLFVIYREYISDENKLAAESIHMLLLFKLYKTTGESRKGIDKEYVDYSFESRVSRESFAQLKKYELQRIMPHVFGCLDDILHNESSNMR